jgi:hypothetical protein
MIIFQLALAMHQIQMRGSPPERKKKGKERTKAIVGLLSSGAGTARRHHHRRAGGPPAPNGTRGIAVLSPVTRRPLQPPEK